MLHPSFLKLSALECPVLNTVMCKRLFWLIMIHRVLYLGLVTDVRGRGLLKPSYEGRNSSKAAQNHIVKMQPKG